MQSVGGEIENVKEKLAFINNNNAFISKCPSKYELNSTLEATPLKYNTNVINLASNY